MEFNDGVLLSGATSLFTDLYVGDNGGILHQTPFTTWLITIHPAYSHINIDDVERVELVLEGPYLN